MCDIKGSFITPKCAIITVTKLEVIVMPPLLGTHGFIFWIMHLFVCSCVHLWSHYPGDQLVIWQNDCLTDKIDESYGFQAFSEEQMKGMASNLTNWYILTTSKTDQILFMINVANLHAICLWGMGSGMGIILGFWAFSGQQMEVMVSNLLCWCVLPTFSMDFIWVKSRSVYFLTLMYFVGLHGMAAPLCCRCKLSLKLFLKSVTELFNQASFYLNESTAIVNCYAWALWIWSIVWFLHIKGIISFVCKLKSEKPWPQGIPSLPVKVCQN